MKSVLNTKYAWPFPVGAVPAYGLCPECGEPGTSRERSPYGYTFCDNGHKWRAHKAPPGLRKSYEQEQIDKLLDRIEHLERILRTLGINVPKDESERKVGAAYTSDKDYT